MKITYIDSPDKLLKHPGEILALELSQNLVEKISASGTKLVTATCGSLQVRPGGLGNFLHAIAPNLDDERFAVGLLEVYMAAPAILMQMASFVKEDGNIYILAQPSDMAALNVRPEQDVGRLVDASKNLHTWMLDNVGPNFDVPDAVYEPFMNALLKFQPT